MSQASLRPPALSLPIDTGLDKAIEKDKKQSGLSRADVVRIALRRYYGLERPAPALKPAE